MKSIFSFEDLKNISETIDERVVIASVGYYNKYKVGVGLQGGGWGIKWPSCSPHIKPLTAANRYLGAPKLTYAGRQADKSAFY